MGLDLALGGIVLLAAFRGWFQGFVSQVVRIASLIACVYLGDQVRDHARPYVVPYLSTIQPDLVDRLLWWVSAATTYIVMVGVAMLVVKMTRRPEIPGISRSGRNDQFAGFLLGSAKGLLIAAFLAAGILKYGSKPIETVSWAQDQVKASWALRWSETYQPVPRIWSARPVRHFVDHIQRMGLQKPEAGSQSPAGEDLEEDSPVRTASRPTDHESAGAGPSPVAGRSSSGSEPAASPPEAAARGPETE
ncbi:MAG: CvpA family protein [Isosphaerales bacterium]